MALVCMSGRRFLVNETLQTERVETNFSSSTISDWNSTAYLVTSPTSTFAVTGLYSHHIGNVSILHSGHNEEFLEFQWDVSFEGLVLSSYYYGYLATLIISSYLERLCGPKKLIGMSVFVGAMVNALTPEMTRANKYFLVGLRIVAGATNGMIDPPVQSLWVAWAPPSELASLTSVEYTGISIGGVLTFFLSGLLCQIPYNNGWPFVFYLYSVTSLVWLCVYWILVQETPSSHPRISFEELGLLHKDTELGSESKRHWNPPWLSIARSSAVWAIVVASVSFMWVYSWILAYLPRYMHNILKFNIYENTLFSPLPFFGKFLSSLCCGWLADHLLRTGMSVSCNRKLFQLVGSVGCAVFTVTVGFLDYHSRYVAVALLILAVVFQNMTAVGFRINIIDIAPKHASFILSITNSIAVAACLTAPLITSRVIQDDTQDQWQTMFYLVSALSVFGGLAFAFFGTAEVQEWARDRGNLKENVNETSP